MKSVQVQNKITGAVKVYRIGKGEHLTTALRYAYNELPHVGHYAWTLPMASINDRFQVVGVNKAV